MLVDALFFTSPPMAKLWPSANCTVVSALREVKDGSTEEPDTPEMVTPEGLSSDTSGRTCRLMRPPPRTVGVKRTDTPNSFSCSVMSRVPLALPWLTGMRILLPARKLPVCPLMAMMLGSASTLTRPSVFCMFRLTVLADLPGTVP